MIETTSNRRQFVKGAVALLSLGVATSAQSASAACTYRYYLSPVTVEDIGGERTITVKVAQYVTNWGAAYAPNDPVTGLSPFALVIVAAHDHSGLLADPEIAALPDVSLDTPLRKLGGNRGQLAQSLQRFGLLTVVMPKLSKKALYREVIRAILQLHHGPLAHEDNFWVSCEDIPPVAEPDSSG